MHNQLNYGPGMGWGPGMMGGHAWILGLLAIAAPILIVFVLWSIFWKGLALWHAARRGQYWWFLILLVVNTIGILEIIYLFFVAKVKWQDLFSAHEHTHSH